jgi:metal-sulfur cluster biosynthetic enzyme
MHDGESPAADLQAVTTALGTVVDPCSIATGVPINLIDMGMIQDIRIVGERVCITLRLTSPLCLQVGDIVREVERRVGEVAGVSIVECDIDPAGEWLPTMMDARAQARLRRLRPAFRRS